MKSRVSRAVRMVVEELEPRILYSADAAVLLNPGALVHSAEVRLLATYAAPSDSTRVDGPVENAVNSASVQTQRREIVFVDTGISGYEQLLADLHNDPTRTVETVLLDTRTDGIDQISQVLSQRQDISGIHIVSHGNDDAVQLGSSTLDAATLFDRAAQIGGWSRALTADADILIYGCDVAADPQGQALIDALGRLTGADVAASVDLTGSAARGGDWDLEYRTGVVESGYAFRATAATWSGTLLVTAAGTESQVNPIVAATVENEASAAMDGNGNYVVAWTTDNGGTSRGVRLIRFDAAGTALSGEIQVNTVTAGDQRYPSVAMAPGGDFVVVWSSDGQDGAGTGIYARRFDSAGAPQGAESLINNTTAGNQDRPQVAMDGSGNFVVAWTSDQGGDLDIYARRYAANGSALGNEFLVNSVDVANDQDQPAIAMDSAGNFVVAWRTSSTLDGSSTGVFAQRYDSAGSTVGVAFQVNTTGAGAQLEPSVAMNDGGAFVISWTSVNQDGSSNGVYAQRYNAAGVAQGGEFLVNTTTADAQDNSSVAIGSSGNFTIVWSSNNQDGSSRGIYGQAYGFNGAPVGSEFRINTTTSNAQNLPVIAMRASTGDFVVAWEGESGSDADGIAAQRYQSINVAPVTTVPGAQSTNEDTAKVFSSANGNQISIADVDAGGANNEVTLSVTNGTLTLAGITGLTLTSGDGTADAAMTLRGTASAINTALDGLSYNPTANYNGSATLILATTDSVLLSLDIDTSLLGRYAFENTGALGTDTSPAAGYAGTVSGAAAVNDGTRGNVLNLAGAGYIQTTGNYGNPANVTLAAWVNLASADSEGAEVISLGDSVGLRFYAPTGVLRGFFYDGSTWVETDYSTVLAGAGWHHVAFSFDDASDTSTLYLDGVAVGTTSTTASISYTLGADSFIGKHGNGEVTYDFNGNIDEARIYNRALTADEIATLASDLTMIDTENVAVTVVAVNDAPSATNLSAAETYTEDTALDLTNIVVSDVDSANVTATLTLSDIAAGSLSTGTSGAVTSTYSAVTGVWSASGALADVNTLLAGLTFTPAVDFNSNFTIATSVSDGVAAPVTGTKAMTGTAVNDAPTVTDRALSFDGTDLVVVGPQANLVMTSTLTMEAMVQRTGPLGSTQIIVNKEGEYEIGISATGKLQWAFANTTPGWTWVETSFTVPADTWVHVAVTYNSGVVKTYVDGALVDTFNGTGNIGDAYPAMNDLTIGGRQNTPLQRFSGLIDEVRVWNVERSGAEIQAAYDTALAGNEAGLVGYWRFNESAGTTATDSSAQGYDGVLGNGVPADVPTRTINLDYTTAEDNALAVAAPGVLLGATDPEGSALTATLVSGPANASAFTLNPNGSFSYTPLANFNGIDSFVFTAGDGSLSSQPATVSITVTSVDDAPVITSNGGGALASVNVAENATAVTTVAATDVDLPPQALTYSIVGGADQALFGIDANTGALTFVTAPDFETPADAGADNVYDLTVQASDGTLSDTQALAVTVTAVNDNSPVITSNGGGASASVNVAENATAVTTVAATDADLPAQTLTYSIVGGADQALFGIDANTGVLTFITAPDFEVPVDAGANNVYDVTVQASDGTLSDTQAVAVTVTPLNDNSPVITSNGGGASASVNVAENATAVTTVSASDADLPVQTLTYAISGGVDAARFAIDVNTGALTFVTAPDFEVPGDAGADNVYDVTVQASDGTLSDTQAVAVTVTAGNDNSPVITSNGGGASASMNVAENATAVTTVTATDADLPVQTLTYSISGGADAAQFAIDVNTGVLTFVTAPDFETPTDAGANNVYDVTVQASDGSGGIDTQAIAVTVTPVNDNAPVIGAGQSFSLAENSANAAVVGTVLASDADSGTSFSGWIITGGNTGGAFTIDGVSGQIAVANSAALDFESNPTFTLTLSVSDGTLTSAAQNVTINLSNVNEAPTLAIPVADQGATEDSAFVLTFPANTFADVDVPDTLTYTTNVLPGWLSFNAAARTFIGTPTGADVGTFTVVLTATDSALAAVSDSFDIVVANINDAPAGADAVITTLEDTAYIFAAADFGFADVADSPANALAAVRVNTLPVAGALTLSGAAVSAGQFVSVTDIATGNLRFAPAPDASGAAYAAFTFQVQDDGGTANGGADLDASPQTMTVNVTTVNDPPAFIPPPPDPPPAPPLFNPGPTSGGVSPVVPVSPAANPGAGFASPAPPIAAAAGTAEADSTFLADAASQADTDSPSQRSAREALNTRRLSSPAASVSLSGEILRMLESSEASADELRSVLLARDLPSGIRAAPSGRGSQGVDESQEQTTPQILTFENGVRLTGVVISAGAVTWALQGAGLLASLLTSVPAWRHLDPLPVLAPDEEEKPAWQDEKDKEAQHEENAASAFWGDARPTPEGAPR